MRFRRRKEVKGKLYPIRKEDKVAKWLFRFVIGCLITMLLLVFAMGNPRFIGGLYWHHIPELLGIYALGFYFARIRAPVKMILVIYFGSVIGNVILFRSSNLELIYGSLIVGAPLPVGYSLGRKCLGWE